jgi:hypothetical protein
MMLLLQINVFSFGGNARAMATGRTYPKGQTLRVRSRSCPIDHPLSGFAQYAPSLYRFEHSCPLRVTNCVDQVARLSAVSATSF